jgi:hypothetical protein
MVTNRRQIPYTATPNEHNRVFLKVMAFARDISCDLHPVRQADAGNLAQS